MEKTVKGGENQEKFKKEEKPTNSEMPKKYKKKKAKLTPKPPLAKFEKAMEKLYKKLRKNF